MGCGGRGSVGRAMRSQGGSYGLVSDQAARRRTMLMRTAKPCGPGTRCWCQVGGGLAGPTGFGTTFNPPMTVARRIRRRGERAISRKSHSRAGMPGDSGEPAASTPVLFFCTGGCGCIGHPAFPTPSGRTSTQSFGRIAPRERDGVTRPAALFRPRHSGAMREHRTRNLEIPGLVLSDHPGMTAQHRRAMAEHKLTSVNAFLTIHRAKIAE
jgi:hypothetical protein